MPEPSSQIVSTGGSTVGNILVAGRGDGQSISDTELAQLMHTPYQYTHAQRQALLGNPEDGQFSFNVPLLQRIAAEIREGNETEDMYGNGDGDGNNVDSSEQLNTSSTAQEQQGQTQTSAFSSVSNNIAAVAAENSNDINSVSPTNAQVESSNEPGIHPSRDEVFHPSTTHNRRSSANPFEPSWLTPAPP